MSTVDQIILLHDIDSKLFEINKLLSIDLPGGQFGGGYNNKKIKF